MYTYPDAVASVAMNKLAKWGQAMRIPDEAALFVRALDAQREAGKAIYGGGFLLSEKAAAEKAAAGDPDTCWTLSTRELELIAEMDRKAAQP